MRWHSTMLDTPKLDWSIEGLRVHCESCILGTNVFCRVEIRKEKAALRSIPKQRRRGHVEMDDLMAVEDMQRKNALATTCVDFQVVKCSSSCVAP